MKENNRININLFFLFLLFLSIFFAYERIINTDAAFYLFKMIHFEGFNIEHGRYSAFISQLLVLPLIKLGINLKVLIYIYSISFVLLFYLVYLIIKHRLKDVVTPYILVFTLCVGLAHPHYRPVSESTQGLVYAMLLPGILNLKLSLGKKDISHIIRIFLSLIVIVLCYFSHPITLFPLLFILAYHIISIDNFKKPIPYIIALLIIAIFSSRYLLGSTSSYEGEKLMNLTVIKDNLKNFISLYPTRFYIKRIPTVYLIPFLLYTTTLLIYFRKNMYLKLFLLLAGFFGFFLVHNIIYYQGGADIELEKNFMVLNFFVFFAFFRDVFFFINKSIFRHAILGLTLFYSILISLRPAIIYKDRINYHQEIAELVNEVPGNKFYAFESDFSDKILFTWGLGVETLLFSSAKYPNNAYTLYSLKNPGEIPEYIEDPSLFLCVPFWERWDINSLNKEYFNLDYKQYQLLEIYKLK